VAIGASAAGALALPLLIGAFGLASAAFARADAPAGNAPIATKRPTWADAVADRSATAEPKPSPNGFTTTGSSGSGLPARPSILFNRWQEDWSVLADPATPQEPFDQLKYIRLFEDDPKTYLSFGAGVRERFEANDAPNFGAGGARPEDYLISRIDVDADLRVASQVQAFVQLQSDFAPWKSVIHPVDQDRLDLEQAFVTVSEPVDDGTLRLRIGRQQIGFDLQRFVSVRDGPNIRQSYDAVWAEYERDRWRLTGFFSLPVQDRDLRAFDDYSSTRLTYGGVHATRKLFGSSELSVTLSRFTQDGAKFLAAQGDERRDIVDVHLSGSSRGYDWDVEGMNQIGRIGSKPIEAWAVGSLGGYTFSRRAWSPRFGLQIDAASGDGDPAGHTFGTFNPLFPNGYYVTLAGYTGYVNFIHLKPSVTLQPATGVKVALAAAGQWRETTADAVYTQPDLPVSGTAGQPGSYTGTYGQMRIDWAATPHVALALEAVHFAVADVIRRAGGHDGDYLGLQTQYRW